jgi:glyoxylase-like metal-dependent hydrolase (beta-lactamase superfamily II)
MKSFLSRRSFMLASACGALAAGLLAPRKAAAGAARAKLVAVDLGDGLAWIRGAGANLVVLDGPEGLVFVDGGLKEHAAAVLSLARSQHGGKPLAALLNTHWHPEHTGLNERLGREGAKIIAHENTRLWLSTTVRYEPDGPPILPMPTVGRPTLTTYRDGELQVGEETVKYGYLSQAHTDGDLWVHLTRADVLVTGGVVAGDGWPIADWVTGGWINGTVSGYQALISRCSDRTRIVSAYGDRLLTKSELQAQHRILAKLAGDLARMMRSGYGPADVLAANPARDYVEQLGDPTKFLTESFRSMWPRMAPDA